MGPKTLIGAFFGRTLLVVAAAMVASCQSSNAAIVDPEIDNEIDCPVKGKGVYTTIVFDQSKLTSPDYLPRWAPSLPNAIVTSKSINWFEGKIVGRTVSYKLKGSRADIVALARNAVMFSGIDATLQFSGAGGDIWQFGQIPQFTEMLNVVPGPPGYVTVVVGQFANGDGEKICSAREVR